MNDSTKPPKLATLLLRLFATELDLPQIEGDLSEEFHNRLRVSGANDARGWYWREAFRNSWALVRRPSTIQVLVMAALSVFVVGFSAGRFFQWLDIGLRGAPRVPGLRLLLLALFETAIALALGVVVGWLLAGRERTLRLAFTGLFLLFLVRNLLMFPWPRALDLELLLFTLNLVSSALIVFAFWIGTTWINRRGLRRVGG